VYSVVTVTVNSCQVFHFVVAVISIQVMYFYRVIHVEVKPTFSTFALLPFDSG
jgi:hypothetical protein